MQVEGGRNSNQKNQNHSPTHPQKPKPLSWSCQEFSPRFWAYRSCACCLVNELAIGLWNTIYPVLLWYLNKLHWSLHISSFQFLFQQLGMLVSFVRSHIRPYMDEIVTLMRVSTIFKPAFYCQKMWIVFLSLSNLSSLHKFIWSAEFHTFEVIIVFWNNVCLKQ